MPTFSSREFDQRSSEAKKAAAEGPVFITDRGAPRYVLMTNEDYRRLKDGASIAELLSMPEADGIGFEPPKARDIARPADPS